MALNIKNAETYQLVRELAEETGESMTEAITTAVRERLERIRQDFDVDEILEFVDEIREHLPAEFFEVDHAEVLYDQDGLPK